MKKTVCVKEKINTFSLEKTCLSDNYIKNLLEIIGSHQNESAVQLGKSIIYFILDDFESVLVCLKDLTENFPEISLLHRRIAELYIRENNYQKAIPHLEKVLKLDAKDLTAKVWLNLSYYKMGRIKEANSNLDKLKDSIFVLNVIERSFSSIQS